MKYYQQALIVTSPPITLESFLEWELLVSQARGEEADRIGELFESMIFHAPEVYEEYTLYCLEQQKSGEQ